MKYIARLRGEQCEFTLERRGNELHARSGDRHYVLDVAAVGDGDTFSLLVDGTSWDVVADIDKELVTVQMLGEAFAVHVEDEREQAAHAVSRHEKGGRRELRAAMPGIVVDIKVAVGDAVEEGQTLLVLEAMKMQNPLVAEAPGKVVKVHGRKGEPVTGGALLIELE